MMDTPLCEVCGRAIDDLGLTSRECDNCQRYCCVKCKPDWQSRCCECPTQDGGTLGAADSGNLEPTTFYEIVLDAGSAGGLATELDLRHDNPEDVIRVRDVLIARGAVVSHVTRDGVVLDEAELRNDLESYTVGSHRREDSKLRPTYRPGKGGGADYGETASGRQTPVWRPPNPEDRFD